MTTGVEQTPSSPAPDDGDAGRTCLRGAEHLAAEGRRSDPRDRREVRRQSRHRHGLDDGAGAGQPGPLRLRPAARALLRLRRGQRHLRLRLEPVAPVRDAQDRQGPAALPGRRGVGRLRAVGRRGPGAGPRPARAGPRPSAPGTYRIERYRPRIEGLFARIERWTDTADGRDALALDHARQRHDGVRQGRRLADRRARHGGPRADLQLADLGELRRQGQRDPLHVQAGGRGRRRPLAGERAEPVTDGEPASEVDPVRQPRQPAGSAGPRTARRRVDVRGRPRLRRARRRRSEAGRPRRLALPQRSVLVLPRRLRGADLPPVPAHPGVPSLSAEEPDVGADCLVRSLDLAYKSSRGVADDVRRGNPVASCIASITQTGYRRKPAPGDRLRGRVAAAARVRVLRADHRRPAFARSTRRAWRTCPEGSTGRRTSWVDLDGEGVSGSPHRAGGRVVLQAEPRRWPFRPGRDRRGETVRLRCSATDAGSCSTWPETASSISSSSAVRRPASSSGPPTAAGARSRTVRLAAEPRLARSESPLRRPDRRRPRRCAADPRRRARSRTRRWRRTASARRSACRSRPTRRRGRGCCSRTARSRRTWRTCPATGSATSSGSATARWRTGRASATAASARRSRWTAPRCSRPRTSSARRASAWPTSTARAARTSSTSNTTRRSSTPTSRATAGARGGASSRSRASTTSPRSL